jgi:SAM-dependent methyltransferase
MNTLDQADFDFLQMNVEAGKQLRTSYFRHFDQPANIWNYIRIATDITHQVKQGHVLDWGSGDGQMTYLLRRRGLQVTPFDIGSPYEHHLPDVPLCRSLDTIRTTERTVLPFQPASFDAVLSCGVLEHVDSGSEPGNEIKSLHEIARVLRPGGLLLIYQLPQQYAWQEALIRRFKLGYAHPRRYTACELRQMLRNAGFRVRRVHRANMIPKNLTGLPASLRKLYSRSSRPVSRSLIALDGFLSQIPLLNHIAGVLEVTAQRKTQ